MRDVRVCGKRLSFSRRVDRSITRGHHAGGTRLAFVFAATIRQFQPRFAASARKKSFGSASPAFAVYKARSEQPFFVVWGPWTVLGLECKKSPELYALFSLMKSPSKMYEHLGGFFVQVRRDECTGQRKKPSKYKTSAISTTVPTIPRPPRPPTWNIQNNRRLRRTTAAEQ